MDQHYQHQITASNLLGENDVYALIMEQGTGKSRPIIDDWLARVSAGTAQDLVILAPKGCYLNWIGTEEEPGELTRWIPPDYLATINIGYWRSGGTVAHRTALSNLLHAKSPRFLAMNIEALNREGKARDYLLSFIRDHKVIGVIDESTTICHEEAA